MLSGTNPPRRFTTRQPLWFLMWLRLWHQLNQWPPRTHCLLIFPLSSPPIPPIPLISPDPLISPPTLQAFDGGNNTNHVVVEISSDDDSPPPSRAARKSVTVSDKVIGISSPPPYASLSQSTPLSVLHLPRPGNGSLLMDDIYVAGRFTN